MGVCWLSKWCLTGCLEGAWRVSIGYPNGNLVILDWCSQDRYSKDRSSQDRSSQYRSSQYRTSQYRSS